MTNLSISELSIYPIKSARGLSLQSIKLHERGPECDRRWMIVDNKDSFVTQRKFPKMCLIKTEFINGELYVSADGLGQCHVPAGGEQVRRSSVWGTTVEGEDCGDHAATWISEYIDKECRVIYMNDNYSRLVDPRFATQGESVGFADGFPLLVTTQASLDDFNSKLIESGAGFEVSMDRFRPNIVITGNPAWSEDTWKGISVNGIELSLVKPCSRCIMPSVNPQTGEKQMEVNQALLKYRRRNKQTYFGQNALYNSLGIISVGDSVEIIE